MKQWAKTWAMAAAVAALMVLVRHRERKRRIPPLAEHFWIWKGSRGPNYTVTIEASKGRRRTQRRTRAGNIRFRD